MDGFDVIAQGIWLAIFNTISGLISGSASLVKEMGPPIFENKYLHFIEMLCKYILSVLLLVLGFIAGVIWLLGKISYKFCVILYKLFSAVVSS